MIHTKDIINNEVVYKNNLYDFRDDIIKFHDGKAKTKKWYDDLRKKWLAKYNASMISFEKKLSDGSLED